MKELYLIQTPGLSFFEKNDNRVIIFNRNTSKSHIISNSAYQILRALDGLHDVSDLCACFSNYDEREIVTLLRRFLEYGLCTERTSGTCELGFLNLLKRGRIILCREPDEKFIFKCKAVQQFFKFALLLSPLLASIQFVPLIMALKDCEFTMNIEYSGVAIAVFLWSLFLHELSHGIIAKSYNANIGEFGVQFQFSICFIRFYTTICGFSYINEKRRIFTTHIAGILSNFFTVSVSSLLLYSRNPELIKIAILTVLINYLCALIDFIPYRGSDGYKALSVICCSKNQK